MQQQQQQQQLKKPIQYRDYSIRYLQQPIKMELRCNAVWFMRDGTLILKNVDDVTCLQHLMIKLCEDNALNIGQCYKYESSAVFVKQDADFSLFNYDKTELKDDLATINRNYAKNAAVVIIKVLGLAHLSDLTNEGCQVKLILRVDQMRFQKIDSTKARKRTKQCEIVFSEDEGDDDDDKGKDKAIDVDNENDDDDEDNDRLQPKHLKIDWEAFYRADDGGKKYDPRRPIFDSQKHLLKFA